MRITVDEARSLAERVLVALDHSAEYARIIADHLIDCELRGCNMAACLDWSVSLNACNEPVLPKIL